METQEVIIKAIDSIVDDMAKVEPQFDIMDFMLTELCKRFSKNDMCGLFCKHSDMYGDCNLCRYQGECADGLKQSYLSKGKQDNETV